MGPMGQFLDLVVEAASVAGGGPQPLAGDWIIVVPDMRQVRLDIDSRRSQGRAFGGQGLVRRLPKFRHRGRPGVGLGDVPARRRGCSEHRPQSFVGAQDA